MTNSRNNCKPAAVYTVFCIAIAALVAFDQFTKHLAVVHLKNSLPVDLIHGVLSLQYLENRGAAWGMLQNSQILFYIITAAFLVFIVFVMIRIPKNRYYLPVIAVSAVLAAGAAGNLIDRIAHKYVVDFIYFYIINFPIFNVADIYVTISVILLLILVLFHYKESDFRFIRRGPDSKTD